MAQLYDAGRNPVNPTTGIADVADGFATPLSDYLAASYMKGINHRGYSTDAPENTLPAYYLSYKHGFKFVECDISYTSDGVPVLLHDSTIDRTSNGTGNINDLTFAQVREYDFGSWFSAEYAGTKIPSLAEFLVFCRNTGLHPYLELKSTTTYTTAQIQQIVDMVEMYGMKGKVTYISFSNTYLASVVAYDSKARVGYVVSAVNSTNINRAIALRTGENEVFLDSSVYNSAAIESCLAVHLPLEVWTIDNKATIEGLDDYISGVTSDDKNASFIKLEKSLSVFESE